MDGGIQKQASSSSKIMWCVLPSEIEENILSRLPVESLMRFRCVSKHWCNLVTDSHFIKMHLHNRSSTQINECPQLIVRAKSGKLYYVDVNAWVNQCFKTSRGHRNIKTELVLPFRRVCHRFYLKNSGSCNGLLCLSDYDRLYLLNLATNEFKILPYPQQICSPKLTGFGYSPRTDEYKLMVTEGYRHCDHVYVYTLGNNSSWRSIGRFLEYRIKDPRHHHVLLVNGVLHWMASGTSGFSIVLISFDLGDEKLRELSLPKSFSQEDTASSHDHSVGLVELGGFLSLYHCNAKEKFDIWVMKEYGDERSWTKVFSAAQPILSEIQEPIKPLYILKKDELVLCEGYEGFFILDVAKKQIHKLRFSHQMYYSATVTYLESLVSP